MKELSYGKDYHYAHDYPHNFVFQDFMPEELQGTTLYEPCDNPKEKCPKSLSEKPMGRALWLIDSPNLGKEIVTHWLREA